MKTVDAIKKLHELVDELQVRISEHPWTLDDAAVKAKEISVLVDAVVERARKILPEETK